MITSTTITSTTIHELILFIIVVKLLISLYSAIVAAVVAGNSEDDVMEILASEAPSHFLFMAHISCSWHCFDCLAGCATVYVDYSEAIAFFSVMVTKEEDA